MIDMIRVFRVLLYLFRDTLLMYSDNCTVTVKMAVKRWALIIWLEGLKL